MAFLVALIQFEAEVFINLSTKGGQDGRGVIEKSHLKASQWWWSILLFKSQAYLVERISKEHQEERSTLKHRDGIWWDAHSDLQDMAWMTDRLPVPRRHSHIKVGQV